MGEVFSTIGTRFRDSCCKRSLTKSRPVLYLRPVTTLLAMGGSWANTALGGPHAHLSPALIEGPEHVGVRVGPQRPADQTAPPWGYGDPPLLEGALTRALPRRERGVRADTGVLCAASGVPT